MKHHDSLPPERRHLSQSPSCRPPRKQGERRERFKTSPETPISILLREAERAKQEQGQGQD